MSGMLNQEDPELVRNNTNTNNNDVDSNNTIRTEEDNEGREGIKKVIRE